MAMISFLVYCLSNRMAIIHSFIFCTILKGRNLDPSPWNNCLANCCVNVLAPPLVPKLEIALKVPLPSIPECS